MRRQILKADMQNRSDSAQISMRLEQANYIYTEAFNSLFAEEKLHVRNKVATLIKEKKFDTVYKLISLIGQKSLDFMVCYPEAPLPKPEDNYLFAAIRAFFSQPEQQQLLFEFIKSILKYDPVQSQFVASKGPDKGRTVLHVALLHMTRRSDFDVSMIRSLVTVAPNLINIPTTSKKALPLELALCIFRSDLFELFLGKTADLNYRNGANKTIFTLISEAEQEVARRGYPPIQAKAITEINTLFTTELARRKNIVEVARRPLEKKDSTRQFLKAKRRAIHKPKPPTFSLDMSDSYQREVAISLARAQIEYKQKQALENACRILSLLSLSDPHVVDGAGKKKQLPALARLTVFAANVVEQKQLGSFTYINSTCIPDAESLPTSRTDPAAVAEAIAKKQYPICAERVGNKKQLPAIARLTVFAANVAEQQRLDSISYQKPTGTSGVRLKISL